MNIYGAAYGVRMGPSLSNRKAQISPVKTLLPNPTQINRIVSDSLTPKPSSAIAPALKNRYVPRSSSDDQAMGFVLCNCIASLFSRAIAKLIAYLFPEKAITVMKEPLLEESERTHQSEVYEQKEEVNQKSVDRTLYNPEIDLPKDEAALRRDFCLGLTEAFDFTLERKFTPVFHYF